MTKRTVLHLILSIMFLSITVLLEFLPDGYASIREMLFPIFFFTILTSVFCGTIWSLLVSAGFVLIKLFLLKSGEWMPDLLFLLIMNCMSGIVSGILYALLKRSIISVIGGVLMSWITVGLEWMIYEYNNSAYFGLSEYLDRALFSVWPGIAATVVLIPLIVLGMRATGLMSIFREMPRRDWSLS